MNVKQFEANMQLQVTCVLYLFLGFMSCHNASKAHNMLLFMLDPCVKHFSLVGDYVGHAAAIDIAYAYDAHFFLPTLQELY